MFGTTSLKVITVSKQDVSATIINMFCYSKLLNLFPHKDLDWFKIYIHFGFELTVLNGKSQLFLQARSDLPSSETTD